MNRRIFIVLMLAAGLAAPACGGDNSGNNKAVTPPDVGSRQLPNSGPPAADAGWDAPPPRDAYVPNAHINTDASGECCPVTFAYAPTNPEQVDSMVLRGSASPLDTADGIAMTEDNGVWSAEACIAPDYVGVYYFEVALKTGGDPFMSVAHSPYVPTTNQAGDVVNTWATADDCASIDTSVYAQTSD